MLTEVHRSNMAKVLDNEELAIGEARAKGGGTVVSVVQLSDGNKRWVVRGPSGDVLNPLTYRARDLRPVLGEVRQRVSGGGNASASSETGDGINKFAVVPPSLVCAKAHLAAQVARSVQQEEYESLLEADPEKWHYPIRDGVPWTGPGDAESRSRGLNPGEEDWEDTSSPGYINGLKEPITEKRITTYSHLPERVWQRVLLHMDGLPQAYLVKGTKPTEPKGYIVQWE